MKKRTRKSFVAMAGLASVLLAKKHKRMDDLALARSSSQAPFLEKLRADPCLLMKLAGKTPDPWQRELICSTSPRTMILAGRQVGKSAMASVKALNAAFLEPGSLVLLLSPGLRQSSELFQDKLIRLYDECGRPIPAAEQTRLTIKFANGSRVISLPGEEKTIRGYSGVKLLVIDEASRVPDDLYLAVRPMLSVSKGSLLALTTPFGKQGWFFEAWFGVKGDQPVGMSSRDALRLKDGWKRVMSTSEECPRISREFLAEEKVELGERWYNQEHACDFTDLAGAWFSYDDIRDSMTDEFEPLFPAGEEDLE
jgi:hypothetical protein